MSVTIDRRCPACNTPLIGSQEVVTLTRVSNMDKKMAQCRNCKIGVKLVALTLDKKNGELADFAFDPPASWNEKEETAVIPMPSANSVVPKTRKSRSPKEEQQIVRETAAIVLKPFGTPLSPEKARDLIAEAMSARVHTPYASSKSSPNPHNDPITAKWLDSTPQVPQLDETPVGVKIKPTATPIVNTVGVEVAKVSRGSKTSYPIFGHSHTKFFLWAGQSQWSVSEVQTALKAFGIPEISVLSIRTFLYAGRKGGDCAGRGEAPKFTAEQAKQLEAAGGRTHELVKPKPIAKKKAK